MRLYSSYLAAETTFAAESPPIGIPRCAAKDEEIVQFATATDEGVLVSPYRLERPSRERLERWLHEAREAAEATVRHIAQGSEGRGRLERGGAGDRSNRWMNDEQATRIDVT